MHEIVDKMLNKPIATIVVIGCVAGGIARIISAVKGTDAAPALQVTVSDHKSDT